MEKIDFSENSKRINELYTSIVRGDRKVTYGVFTVNNHSVLDVTASGLGELQKFLEEFDDGAVQFGLVRVTIPGSDVYKNILLGWCPDNAPTKLRLAFAPTFAEISKLFSGYHVQITARDNDDLDASDILSRVIAAAGARYTQHTTATSTAQLKVSSRIGTTPSKQNLKPDASKGLQNVINSPDIVAKARNSAPVPLRLAKGASPTSSKDDGWGNEKPVVERDLDAEPLKDLPSAYVPTKVDIKALRSQKSDTITSSKMNKEFGQAKETDKKLLGASKPNVTLYLDEGGRLTELPKPKTNNSVSNRYSMAVEGSSSVKGAEFGSIPGNANQSSVKEKPKGLFQNHAHENGLSPAQLWAQKRGKYVIDTKKQDTEKEVGLERKVAGLRVKNFEDEEEHPPASSIESEVTHNHIERDTDESEAIEHPSTRAVEMTHVFSSKPRSDCRAEESLQNISGSPVDKADVYTKPNSLRNAVALYDYEKDEDNEVSFEEGDLITDIEFVDEEWWSGKNSRTGKLGVFPGSYVTLEGSTGNKTAPRFTGDASKNQQVQDSDSTSHRSAIAEYDYEKEEDNEIGFNEGDLIIDIEFVDEDWWSGKHSVSGETGVFPANFVSLQ